MLKFSNNRVNKEYSGLCCIHTHGNEIECKNSSSIFSNLNVFRFAVYCLNLQLLGQGGRMLAFDGFVLENVLSLISYHEIDHL